MKRRSITLTDYQARGMGLVAAKHNMTVQQIMSEVVDALLLSEAQADRIMMHALERVKANPVPQPVALPTQMLN